jgi:hypothetical protein
MIHVFNCNMTDADAVCGCMVMLLFPTNQDASFNMYKCRVFLSWVSYKLIRHKKRGYKLICLQLNILYTYCNSVISYLRPGDKIFWSEL